MKPSGHELHDLDQEQKHEMRLNPDTIELTSDASWT